MWFNICKFEILYKLRRPEVYVYFLFLLVVSIFAFDFIFYQKEMGSLESSSPQVIGTTMAILSGFFMIIISMVMGVPIIKDYEHKVESILFVSPIRKWEYFTGRYVGSFVVLIVVFSAILIGMMIGDHMPWRKVSTKEGNYLFSYLYTYVLIVFPALFYGGSLFFVIGLLSRKMIVVYTQGLVFFLILLVSMKVENPLLAGMLDAFSHIAIRQVMSSVDSDVVAHQLIPLRGALLYNRLFWCSIGLGSLVYGYFKFSFEIDYKKLMKPVHSTVNTEKISSEEDFLLPKALPTYGLKAVVLQFREHSLFFFISLLRKPVFWVIILCGIVSILVNSINLGAIYGVDTFPVTYLLLDELKEMSIFFFLLMFGLFTSEVIWRERKSNIDQIIDALPISDLVVISGKFVGLVGAYLVLLVCMFLFGILFQSINGFYDFQFETYLLGLGELWLFLVLFTFLSFFFQIVSNSQFIGHLLLVIFFMLTGLLSLNGFTHGLYDFGGLALKDYSDLDGYGDSVYPFVLFKSYWLAFSIALLALTAGLIPRGNDVSLRSRIWGLRYRLTPAIRSVVGLASLGMLLLGAFIFYNTNVLNQYQSGLSKTLLRSEYEKTLKHLQYVPQPKIIDVSLLLDLFPEDRGFQLEGMYLLKNLDSINMHSIHVQTFTEGTNSSNFISFNREAALSKAYPRLGYSIYEFEDSLAPGDSVQMRFRQVSSSIGFTADHSSSDVNCNGTFLNNDKFPSLGYCSEIELSDVSDREAYGLGAVDEKAERDHPFEIFNGRDGDDGSCIGFDIVVSTDVDQIAIAPGVLENEWSEKGRRYFQYTIQQPMINFYAITSARYDTLKSRWNSADEQEQAVDLEIYYHPSHSYNVVRMMEGLEASLSYCTSAFGPYPYSTLKIVEVPRDFDRAQSFPSMIAYSESMGFILDIDPTTDLDVPFFITAHEVAHQWWGMQLVAANVKGKNFLLESLSHYSALMIYQETYGVEQTKRLIDFEMKRYHVGRQEDLTPEVALIDVTDQEYLYYSKAAVQFYELQDLMGEDQLNQALRDFLNDWRVENRLDRGVRFAFSTDLLPYILANASENLQPDIISLFEGSKTIGE